MRSLVVLLTLLLVFAWGWLSPPLLAQDFFPSEVESSDRVSSVMNAPDPSDHAGLLGKIYMQQRYVSLKVDERHLRQIDKSLQGFDTFINLPAITLDLPTPLDFDVFFGYGNLGLKGSEGTGPPLDLTVGMNAKIESYTVGTTIYPTLSEKWRPFVQVGAQFSRSDTDISVNAGQFGSFAVNDVDHETRLLLNGGFETDLLDCLAYRMALHAETEDRFLDSRITNDLILWPHDKIFVRGGIVSSLDGGGLGFTVGGGLAF